MTGPAIPKLSTCAPENPFCETSPLVTGSPTAGSGGPLIGTKTSCGSLPIDLSPAGVNIMIAVDGAASMKEPDCSDIFAEDCDIAGAACATDFEAATTSVFYGEFAYGHTGILVPPYQERIYTEVAAWFRWQLMQDHALKSRFAGPNCSVCSDPNWTVQRTGDLL